MNKALLRFFLIQSVACVGYFQAGCIQHSPGEELEISDESVKAASETSWFALSSEDTEDRINALNRPFTPCADFNPLSVSCEIRDAEIPSSYRQDMVTIPNDGSVLVKGKWSVKEFRIENFEGVGKTMLLTVASPLYGLLLLPMSVTDSDFWPNYFDNFAEQKGYLMVESLHVLAVGKPYYERRGAEGDYYWMQKSCDAGEACRATYERVNKSVSKAGEAKWPTFQDAATESKILEAYRNGGVMVFGALRDGTVEVKDIYVKKELAAPIAQ